MHNLQMVVDSLKQFVRELKLSLESHLDTLVEEVVDENFHGDPSKMAKRRIFLRADITFSLDHQTRLASLVCKLIFA